MSKKTQLNENAIANQFSTKKEQVGNYQSIRVKIMLWAGSCLILLATTIVVFSAITIRNRAIEAAKDQVRTFASLEVLKAKSQLEVALKAARNLASVFSAIKDPDVAISLSRDQANGMLRKIHESNPQFLGTYTLWEPNEFDGRDSEFVNTEAHDETGRFIPYWIRGSEGLKAEALVDYEVPGDGDWYLLPKNTHQETVFPVVYPVEGVDTFMTASTVPIIVEGQFYGIAGVDLKSDFLQRLTDEIQLYDGAAKMVLISNYGKFTGVTGQADMLDKSAQTLFPEFDNFKQFVQEGETITQVKEDTLQVFTPMYLGASKIPWTLGITVPLDKITAGPTNIMWRMIIISLLLTLGALLLLSIFARRLTLPLKKLTDLSQKISQGSLVEAIDVKTNDEIGILADAFDNAIVSLKGAIQEIETRTHETESNSAQLQSNIMDFLDVMLEVSEGNFNKRGEVTEDALGNVVDATNLMLEEIGFLLTDVQQTARDVGKGANEMLSTSALITQNNEARVATGKRLAEGLKVIANTMQIVGKNVSESAQTAQNTLLASQEGSVAVQNSLEGMERIRQEVDNIALQIGELNVRSKEISEVTEAIYDISSQVSLLALHASLEAAGAGKAGERFAVVAKEVGELADSSAQLSEKVSQLVKGVQEGITTVTTLVATGKEEVNKGYVLANQTGEKLIDIGNIAGRSADLARAVNEQISKQVERLNSMNKGLQSMSQAGLQSQEIVERGGESANHLRASSQALLARLGRFKLGEAN